MTNSVSPAAVNASRQVSVVIPTYQRRDSVARVLRALTNQKYPPAQFEVIVSIDGSDDGTGEMVEAFDTPFALKAIRQPKLGRAAACNAGIRAARGDLIILLDDDMEPAPEFLANHSRAHSDGSRRGVLAAVPVVVEPKSPPVVKYVASSFEVHLKKLSQPKREIGIRDFYSGNFSIRKDLLIEVGLFDEGFRSYGNEDGELAIRLREAGIQLTYCADAVARQHYEKDFAALAHDKMAQGRTSVECAMRHPDVVPHLRIGTYRRGSRKWRLIRGILLAASRVLRSLPDRVIDYVRALERKRSLSLQDRYRQALDYFYWLGVRSALRKHPEVGRMLAL
jgi:glycosyltransferase involved in cell wall biosynthesis